MAYHPDGLRPSGGRLRREFKLSDTKIRSFFLHGPAGRLEALLNAGEPGAPFAAVVAHPHPLFGGTMHNKVVYHAAKTLNELGLPVLRFNFRGVGSSAGEHAGGIGEVEDVRTALEWLVKEFRLPLVFCGFSFGAFVGQRAACSDPRVEALISLGTPLAVDDSAGSSPKRDYRYDHLASCAKPKLFVSGDRDQFASPEALAKLVEGLPEPKRLVLVAGADHFFEGHFPELRAAIKEWMEATVLARGKRA